MNPDSLCARCAHLLVFITGGLYCNKRNCMNSPYGVVCLNKGFKTCINFKPRKEQA